MVQLTDLLERQRKLAEEQERIQRDLGILNQIADLAAQLDEPAAAMNGAVTAPPETETDAPPAPPPPPPKPPAPPGTTGPDARLAVEREAGQRAAAEAFGKKDDDDKPKRKGPSSGQRERLLQALRDLRGSALQIDLKKKSGLDSGTTSVVCRALEEEGVIRRAGKGGYMNKSVRWKLVTSEPETPGVTPRVRRAIENDERERAARRKGPTQPPTHEGRILSLLTINPGFTVPEVAAELSIPASTVGRLMGKLKEEGEVTDTDDRGHFRRVMT